MKTGTSRIHILYEIRFSLEKICKVQDSELTVILMKSI